jgi:signal peptidase I
MNDPVMNVESPETKKGSDRSILLYTAIAIALALIVRFFVAAPYLVSGPSMEPTFQNLDYLIVDRLSYEIGNPHRGDIVIFTMPETPSETLIKRMIGLPGDTVSISGNTVTITNAAHPNGFILAEPYLAPSDLGGPSNLTVTLGADQYFVLGDNRKVSYDSRLWGILPRKDIIGQVFIRLYPFTALGVEPGQARYTNS